MNDLDDIEDFLALAQTCSFTQASSARHVSQPAFTRRIKILEDKIGTPLFDRASLPITLTAAGKRFQTYAENLSKTYTQALQDTRATASHLKNPIRIATTHTLAITLFPTLWKKCLHEAPTLKVSVIGQRTDRCLKDLREGHADFALIHARPHDRRDLTQDFKAALIQNDKLVPVVAAHVKEPKPPILAYAPDVAFAKIITEETGDHFTKQKNIVFESPSSEVLKAMALAGHGIAYLPRLLIEDDIKDGYLVPPHAKLPSIPLDVLFLCRPTPVSPDATIVWNILQNL